MSLLDPEPAARRPPVLVIGVGNPDRGDDAIGPLLLERLRPLLADTGGDGLTGIELLDTYQLQPEHALDLRGRERVIVVDARCTGEAGFTHCMVTPNPERTATTHRLSPAGLAAVHEQLFGSQPPLMVLSVRGERFKLGEQLSALAEANLAAALRWLRAELRGVSVADDG